MDIEEARAKRRATIYGAIGGTFYALVGIGLIASSQENGKELKTSVIMIIVFLIGAIVFTRFAINKKKEYKEYKQKREVRLEKLHNAPRNFN